MMNFKTCLISFKLCFIAIVAASQLPGQLDLTFGTSGQVYEEFALSSRAYAMRILPDDRILIAGIAESGSELMCLIARYMPDGDLDLSFGIEGSVQVNLGGPISTLHCMAVDDDGSIYVAGRSYVGEQDYMLVARFHSDGTLNNTFGQGGYTLLSVDSTSSQYAQSIAIDGAGRIILAGYGYLGTVPFAFLCRLSNAGMPDASFGEGGFVIPPITATGFFPLAKFESVAIQPDGKIVAAGYYGVPLDYTGWVARYLEDGSPDTSFGIEGATLIDNPAIDHLIYDVKLTAEGHIMVGGNYRDDFGSYYLLMRIFGNGSIDTNFGINGYGSPPVGLGGSFGREVMVPGYAGSPILIAGWSGNGFSTLRFDQDGMLDAGFAMAGIAVTWVTEGFGMLQAMGRQSDGKLVVAGFRFSEILLNNRVALLRYNMESTLGIQHASTEAQALHLYPNPCSDQVSIEMQQLGAGRLTFYNQLGQLVLLHEFQAGEATVLRISDLPQGMYHVMAEGRDGKLYRQKLIKL